MIENPHALVLENIGLFKLDWVRDPASLKARADEHGLTDRFTVEMSAWCAELHLQLEDLARAAGLHLLLMGGNAAALRADVSSQRGSRDNDYLTTASPAEIELLVKALRERFAVLPEPLFTASRIEPKEAKPLPLISYRITVPALFAPNAPEGMFTVKAEFHLSPPEAMPESEDVEAEFLAIGQKLRARTPRRPHQFVLKAMTLLDPPIGVEPVRADVLPRQIYDLDVLAQDIDGEEDWRVLRTYADARYAAECVQHECDPVPGNPWTEFDRRLDEWASDCADKSSSHWQQINAFQSSQLAKGTKRNGEKWAARMNRLRFLSNCLAAGESGREDWRGALELERLLPVVQGKALKEQRRALAGVLEIAPKDVSVHPRASFWAYLADAQDPVAAIEALDEALSALPVPA